jgi:hypothetical protein
VTQRRWLGLALACLVIGGCGVAGWYRWVQPDIDAEAEARKALVDAARTSGQPREVQAPAPTPEPSTLAAALNASNGDIRADLRIVSDIIETFRTNFLREGNPVGTNAEITAALTGKNKLSQAFVPPNHPAINQAGELCDRWGTPFFFHAESATRMEVRSAGPDKKMWTEDDVTFVP